VSTLVTLKAWAEARGRTVRQAQVYRSQGRFPGAVERPGKGWLVPSDAEPLPATSRDVAPAIAPANSHDVAATSPLGGRFFWTLDEVAGLFAPHVTRYALEQMLREGELVGYKRGAGGAWVVPTGELRRLMGA
jgi:hypothetical protein